MTATIDSSAAHVAATRRSIAQQQPHPHLHVTVHATGRRHVLHDVLDFVLLGLVLVFVWFLWPVNWGGTARFILVQGPSMEPKFHLGDAIIVRSLDDPRPGDVVVFRIPDDQPGHGSYVVHRILKVRDDGTFMTKGDNRDLPDPFSFTDEDIVGRPMWTLPKVGRLIMVFANPLFIGVAIGGIALLLFLPWTRHKGEQDDEDAAADEDPATNADPAPAPVTVAMALHDLPTQELPAIDVLDRQLSALGIRVADAR